MVKGIGKAYQKSILREIRQSFGRFAAITGIVTLGVGFLVGILSTTPDMQASADQYYDENQMTDIFIKATMGLTQEDLEAVAAFPGVEAVTPAYVTDAMVQSDQEELLAARLYGLPLEQNEDGALINHLTLIEGRMPQQPGECVAQQALGSRTAPPVGSTIRLVQEGSGDTELTERFSILEFTVVGIVQNPFYFSSEKERSSIGSGRVDAILYIPEQCYLLEVYTDFYLTLTGAAALNAFEDAYAELVDSRLTELEALGQERSSLRLAQVREEAEQALASAQRELDDAQREADQELNDAWRQLTDARQELDDGWQELAAGKKELQEETAKGQRELIDGERELTSAAGKLAEGEQELLKAQQELEDGQAEYEDGLIQYQDGLEEYREGERQYLEGLREYEEGAAQLAEAWAQLYAGQARLEESKAQLEAGEAQYTAGVQQLEEQRRLLEQGQQELDQGAAQAMAGFGVAVSGVDEALDILESPGTSSWLAQSIDLKRQELQDTVDTLQASADALQQQISAATDPAQREQLTLQLQSVQIALIQTQEALERLPAGSQVISETAEQLRQQKQQLENGWSAIAGGEQQLDASRSQLDDGWKQYREGMTALEDGIAQCKAGEAELADGAAKLQKAKDQLDEAWDELQDAKAELDDAKAQLDSGWQQLEEARQELEDGRQEYESGVKELEQAKSTFARETANARQKLADAEAKLNDGETEYTSGLTEYEDGKAQAEEKLADGRRKLASARQELAELETPEWYVLDRNSNVTFASYKINVQKVADVARVFPVFFFLVSALVTLTTMTRMVEEERTLIGTLKALGYREWDILLKYLIYCGLATATGCVIGVLTGFRLIPAALNSAYTSMYRLPPLITRFEWPLVLVSCFIEAGCTLLATYSVCHQSMQEKPAQLMLPRVPKAGQRIFLERFQRFWKHLSFSYKATVRNIFRYKKHLVMTVLGIGGCTALMLTGFGLRDSVSAIANTQFEKIWRFDLRIEVSGEQPDDILTGFLQQYSYMPVYSETGVLRSGNGGQEASIYVPENAGQLNNFVLLQERASETPLIFDENSVLLGEKLAGVLGLSAGDRVQLENAAGKRADFIVTGITENYAGGCAYIGAEIYRRQFEEVSSNLLLVKSGIPTQKQDQASALLFTSKTVTNVEFHSQTKASYDNLLQSLNYIVLLLIIAAGALAVIVLYNLTNINVSERMKELATLRVLGYHHGEVAAYIFREITILSILGAAFGLFLGFWLHRYVIVTAETVEMMFGRSIQFSSFLWSGILTLLFSALVDLLMLPKIRHIDMTESMKAVD